MGTHAVVALPLDSGFRGRYVHWDGGPHSMVGKLLALAARDGVDQARTQLMSTPEWAAINPTDSLDDNTVTGYGRALDNPDDVWITRDGEDCGTAFAYVLNDDRVSVLRREWDPERWTPVGEALYGQEPDPERLTAWECGENWEACSHYAWYHDDSLPREMRMGMRKWLGMEPLGWNDVIAVITRAGKRRACTGTGGTGTAKDHRRNPLVPLNQRYWWMFAEGERWVRTARILQGGRYKLDVDVVLGATRDEPELIVPRGTVLT